MGLYIPKSCTCVNMCAYVCISAQIFAYACICVLTCLCVHMLTYACIHARSAIIRNSAMHAAMVQTIDHRTLHKQMYTYICIHTYIKLMHATIVQEIDQRAQIYAIQQMHATIIQTSGHSALHKHMQFNPCMQQSFKQLIKELRNTLKNMQTYACIHARSMNICNSMYACFNGPSNRS